MQRNWIGRSEGALVDFKLDGVAGPAGDKITGLHHAHRHDLRRDLAAAGARASDGDRPDRQQSGAAGQGGRPDRRAAQGERSGRHRRDREARRLHRALCAESVQRREGAHLGGELRAAGLRHRRDHVGTGARRARLRIRQEVRARHQDRDPAAARGRCSRRRAERAGAAVRRDQQPADQLGRVQRPALRTKRSRRCRSTPRSKASARRR